MVWSLKPGVRCPDQFVDVFFAWSIRQECHEESVIIMYIIKEDRYCQLVAIKNSK